MDMGSQALCEGERASATAIDGRLSGGRKGLVRGGTGLPDSLLVLYLVRSLGQSEGNDLIAVP
jgi:hypothetical protein